MNMEEMVDIIMKEVYQSLDTEQFGDLSIRTRPSKKAIIIGNQKYPQFDSVLQSEYEMNYFFEKGSSEEIDLVLISDLSICMLANLASGMGQSEEEALVLSVLLKGRRVVVLKEGIEYRRYKSTSPTLLFKLYESYEAKLISYGIEIIDQSELPYLQKSSEQKSLVGNSTESQFDVHGETYTWIDAKLITETLLKKYYLKKIKTISITEKAILTPLAKDYIRATGMIVIRK